MTRRALVFLLTAVALLAVALSTGSQIYYLLLLAMFALLTLSLVSVLAALFTVRVEIGQTRHAVERGGSVAAEAAVWHMSLLPVKSLSLKLSLPDSAGDMGMMELDALPFVRRAYEFPIPCPHRGLYSVGVTGIVVTDVFGLLRATRTLKDCAFKVEVSPRAKALPPMELRSGEGEDSRFARMTEDNASPADVRLWQVGDALKKVHWKLSMRKRELMVRTYEESARPDTLLLMDLYPLGALRSHALTIEDAVCDTAASFARAQLSAGYPVRMPLMNARPTEVSGEGAADAGRFISALTRVPFDSPYSYEKVLMLEMRRMQRTGGAVLITPRLNARVADLAVQLKRGGMSVCVCWITDNRREEALALLSRLDQLGVRAHRIDPWGEGLTAEQMIGQVQYG